MCKQNYDRSYRRKLSECSAWREANKKRKRKCYKDNPKKAAQYRDKYIESNHEKYKAHYELNNDIRWGGTIRPEYCSVCNQKCTPEGHHENYSKPLDVIWMCCNCHKHLHRKDLSCA